MDKRAREELKWAIIMVSMTFSYWIIYVLFIGWFKHFFRAKRYGGDILDFYNIREIDQTLRDNVLHKNHLTARATAIVRANFFTLNETTKVYSPKYNATYCGWRGEITEHDQ